MMTQRQASAEIVTLEGDHDVYTTHELEARLEHALERADYVIADFCTVTYVDATVLGLLIRLKRRYNERLHLVVPADGLVAKVVDATDLRAALRIHRTIEEARRTLEMPSAS
jgi:anti-anti-sigma factor